MLEIANLHATVADKPILNDVSLDVPGRGAELLRIGLEGSVG